MRVVCPVCQPSDSTVPQQGPRRRNTAHSEGLAQAWQNPGLGLGATCATVSQSTPQAMTCSPQIC